ncbi:MAG: Pyrimidine-specific ribonucleoside hydrolase RihA [Chlamydiia bacterium]|nr:Pyrimidine-specific ribonucleoside hydrolase RihA [Chlamydiia bacterium]
MRLFFLLISAFCVSLIQTTEEEKIPLIIDSDAGIDDMIGIKYLLNSGRINLLAITTTSNGMSHYRYGARNLLNFLKLIGNPDIPVAKSKKYPMSPNGRYPTSWREKADFVNNIKLPYNIEEVNDLDSVDFLIETIKAQDKKVTILCTGPLTNLALALIKEPYIKKKIEKVYVIGGAINVRGNLVGKHNGYMNRFAEYNFFLDTKAANIVFHSNLPITLVPIDTLAFIRALPVELYRNLVKSDRNIFSEFVFKNLNPLELFKRGYEPSFWTVVAAAFLLDNHTGNILNVSVDINQDLGPYYGMVTINRLGVPVDICVSVNYSKLYNSLLSEMTR